MRAGSRVVVGLAGHSGTARTLAWAIAEAQATGAQLVVVHATGAAPVPALSTGVLVGAGARSGSHAGGLGARGSLGALETVDRFAAGAVAAARARLGEDSVRIVVQPQAPGELLLHEAGPGDVLVLGGPPREGWWVRSGTTNQVVPRARCPVIVVHEPYGLFDEDASPPPAIGASALRDAVVKGAVVKGAAVKGAVVLGLDGAGPWPKVLRYGFAYAAAHRLPLVAARVSAGNSPDEEWWAALAPWERRHPDVPVRGVVLSGRGDQPAAATRPADILRGVTGSAALLVVGAGGTALHPLGITCRSLVATAGCPVAVLH